ncbi:MAG: DNA polymerase III subunit alpha [Bacteroidales bacterium]|nr:DNA polymerase III subunit alpha [Bacteroidales bacterium]
MPQFTHLHVHSQYSILDGAAKVPDLIKKAKESGMTSLALTDHGSMFGIKKFFNEATSQGIKPILGCEVYIAPESRLIKKTEKDKKRNYHLILLAKNKTGYHNLMKLASKAWIEGFYYRPRIDKEILEEFSEGLIVSSACLGGEISQHILNKKIKEAEKAALWYKNLFGEDYYLELMRHEPNEFNQNSDTFERQEEVNKEIIKMSQKLGIKYIATNDIHYLNKEDANAHDILICLNTKKDLEDPKRMRYTGQEYFKTTQEMAELFKDLPEAISNTQEIADKIEEYSINSEPIMPIFKIPEQFTDENSYLKHLTYEGAKERWGEKLTPEIQERIDFELGTIKKMGFPSYFLIVWDFIKAAREMDISVGPGRGSAAGSVVAYCLKITNIDPVKYDLLFERFLNPDRISMPDIDIDFDEDGRDKILRWVADKYGHKRVAHITTFGTMAPRMAIRDVARVLKLPLSEADRIAKTINEKANNFKKAFNLSPDFVKIKKEAFGEVARTLEYAETLDGSVRQTGIHACGTIIGRDDLENYIPLMEVKDASLYVTQYDGGFVEDVGLLKMDFLGLRTLSIIQDALKNIFYSVGKEIDIENVDYEDKKTFELFGEGNTTGVFQFESDGMKKHLKNLKPNRFEDLIAMNALYRPGPMDYIDDFIARKNGSKKIEYDIPEAAEFLSETYGITVYQEQVMLLSQKLAGFTKGQADSLRKAMGKKKKDLIDKLKPLFIEGCTKNNIPQDKAEKIWTDWEAFASYAFNKSHSTCYADLAYKTGYLKAHYPAQYMAAVLSRNFSNIAKVSIFMDDCKQLGINVLGPDVNESFNKFTVNKKGQIRFGMAAVRGLGEGPVAEIIKEREKNGPFKNVYDFVERMPSSTTNKRVMEALVLSGGFDSISEFKRRDFFKETDEGQTFIEALIKYSNKMQSDNDPSQVSLFGAANDLIQIKKPTPSSNGSDWTELERLNKEKEYVGIYLSDHPLSKDKHIISTFTNVELKDLKNLSNFAGKELKIAGIVNSAEQRFTKTGNPWGNLTIEDFSGSFKIALFSKEFIEYKKFMEKGYKLFIVGKIEARYNNPNEFEFKVKKIQLLDDMDVKAIAIKLKLDDISETIVEDLKDLFSKNKGSASLRFLIWDPESKIWVQMTSQNTKVSINDNIISYLNKEKIIYKLF